MPDPRDPDPTEDDFSAVESLLRDLAPADRELVPPPADVWAGIEAELSAPEPGTGGPGPDDSVIELDSRRRLRPALFVGAAAAAIVVIVGAIVANVSDDGSTATTLASAELVYDAANFDELGADAVATVSLVDTDGALRIQIDESELPVPDGGDADLELWLIEPDAEGNPADLVSLGLVDPDDGGNFDIPAGTDPDVYFVVDISVEPRDGDATHSGRSILRGPLSRV